MKLQFKGDLEGLDAGLSLLAADLGITLEEGGYIFTLIKAEAPTLRVSLANRAGEIVYFERCQFFRALGLAVEQLQAGNESFSICENPAFTMNGPMFDMSQGNAAFNIKTLKGILRNLALMGLNTVMLYTEDNYEVPGRPYFGYMRPTYTQKDLRALDDYAYALGIEMIPCIQTLAHMPDGLRWDCFRSIRDYDACLLVGKEETYEFIHDLLVAASTPFRTKRIHIGMDEAWNLGRGQYLTEFGYEQPIKIMQKHLERVMEIVRELGLEPMMWDDMFFRAGGASGYYKLDFTVPEEVIRMVPEGMRCIYWDYYRFDAEKYEKLLPQHLALDKNAIFAGGCWSWRGYALSWTKTLNTTVPALQTCRKFGVKEVFMTTWGDNGTECLANANLIGCQLFAELAYDDHYDRDKFARRFKFCTGGNLEDFENLEYLDQSDWVKEQRPEDPSAYNTSKTMMWQDILTGLLDKNYEDAHLDPHYATLAPKLKEAIGRNGQFDGLFEVSYLAAHVLSMKAEMGLRLTAAYRAGDKEALSRFAEVELPELSERYRALRLAHMKHWMALYKPFGWDVLDMRYGSMLARIDSAIREVKAYLAGEIDCIEELEAERLIFGKPGPRGLNMYGQFVSPNRIDPRA